MSTYSGFSTTSYAPSTAFGSTGTAVTQTQAQLAQGSYKPFYMDDTLIGNKFFYELNRSDPAILVLAVGFLFAFWHMGSPLLVPMGAAAVGILFHLRCPNFSMVILQGFKSSLTLLILGIALLVDRVCPGTHAYVASFIQGIMDPWSALTKAKPTPTTSSPQAQATQTNAVPAATPGYSTAATSSGFGMSCANTTSRDFSGL